MLKSGFSACFSERVWQQWQRRLAFIQLRHVWRTSTARRRRVEQTLACFSPIGYCLGLSNWLFVHSRTVTWSKYPSAYALSMLSWRHHYVLTCHRDVLLCNWPVNMIMLLDLFLCCNEVTWLDLLYEMHTVYLQMHTVYLQVFHDLNAI